MSAYSKWIGVKFNYLVIIELLENKNKNPKFRCLCDCGQSKDVFLGNLKRGLTKSCGCYNKQAIRKRCLKDLTGQRFGRLVAMKIVERDSFKNKVQWECMCDCGNLIIAFACNLTRLHTQSCGCYMLDRVSEAKTIHGMARKNNAHPLYRIWHGMKARCYNPKDMNYKSYGERGIDICKEWQTFIPFRDWALKNGWSADLSIERKDVNLGYSPINCRFATQIEQARNKRRTIWITYACETKSLPEWCETLGLSYSQIRQRIARGYTFEESVAVPYGAKLRSWRNQNKSNSSRLT